MERARSDNLTPALIASAALHVGAIGVGLIVWPHVAPQILMHDSAVPVTIVTSAPTPDVRPAAEAPVQQTAATPEPVPEAAPEPPAPAQAAPAPVPAPQPKPTPAPKTELNLDALAATLPKPKPTPKKPALDLAALAASAPAAPPRPRSGPTAGKADRGPARAETDLRERPAVGAAQGLAGDWKGALTAKLVKMWNPNCGTEGASNVAIHVEMRLTSDGRVIDAVDLDHDHDQANPVLAAASTRALSAVSRGQPYSDLPRDNYDAWRDITINFNAKEACR